MFRALSKTDIRQTYFFIAGGYILTPQDEKMIREWPFPSSAPSPAVILASDSTENSHRMADFCDRLRSFLPRIKIKKETDIPFEKPAMIVGKHRNIAYQAAPAGKILRNFLTALTDDGSSPQNVDTPVEALLQKIDLPVLLKLYVAEQCPHCPGVMQQLQAMAVAHSNIRLIIIQADAFAASAQKDDVRSVPTLILDDQFRWTGPVDLHELLTLCIERNPADLSSASLRQIIEDGNAERVAEMMVNSGQVFPGLVNLLTHPRWSVRLGAMVTVEYLADQSPALAVRLSDLLWREFRDLPDQVQGDIVHVLGEIASPVNKERLHHIAGGTYEASVKATAAEVLEEM